jgi:hypothetical protein
MPGIAIPNRVQPDFLKDENKLLQHAACCYRMLSTGTAKGLTAKPSKAKEAKK